MSPPVIIVFGITLCVLLGFTLGSADLVAGVEAVLAVVPHGGLVLGGAPREQGDQLFLKAVSCPNRSLMPMDAKCPFHMECTTWMT